MIRDKKILLGIGCIFLATFCFAVNGVFVKLIKDSADLSLVVFFRFFINFLFVAPWAIKNISLIRKFEFPLQNITRNIAGLISISLVFYAIKYMPVANAILLNNTAILFVPIILWAIKGIKTHISVVFSMIVGFLGIILILGPEQITLNKAFIAGLLSGCLGGLALIMVREIAKYNHPFQVLFYYSLTGTIVSLIFVPFFWSVPSLSTWGLLILVGISGALYQIFLTVALSLAPIRIISSLTYCTVLFAALFDWIIWKHIPTINSLLGMSLVILGGIMAVIFGSFFHKKK